MGRQSGWGLVETMNLSAVPVLANADVATITSQHGAWSKAEGEARESTTNDNQRRDNLSQQAGDFSRRHSNFNEKER